VIRPSLQITNLSWKKNSKKLLINHQVDDFARMFTLLHRIKDGLNKLRVDFEEHVKKEGLLAIQSVATEAENEPKQYVETLLQVHKKYHTVVQTAFKNENGFVAALDKACREFVNRNAVCSKSSSKSPELLAKFCDNLLKKNQKSEEVELEETLKSVMTVFKYVEDKDVFQRFYSKMLAKRLISDTSASEDAEESMITKLKEACGFEYTVKLQRMFNDMQTSKDLYDTFKKKFLENHDIGVDLSVLVLCTSAWPLSPPSHPFSIPQSLERAVTMFQQFYQNQHSGRKLHWLFHLAKGEVKANYFKHTKTGYTLQVSTFQMAVLLQYNTNDSYTQEELLTNTSISADILKQILEVLLKAKILLPDGPKYRLNYEFKSKKFRVNLNVPLKSEAKQEQDETHQHVQEDRKLLIQAAIVRVMKTRKTSNYNTLVTEVITQLQARFVPMIPDIKKCIDILIEKEYLERVQGQKDTFNYLA